MTEINRCGSDRRKNSTDVTNEKRTGIDRRVALKNYYRFIKILEKIPVFENLSVDQFQKLINICSKRNYNKGDQLCIEGEESYEMFILLEGELKVTMPDGKEISRIKPVGIVGEMGIFTGETRSASVLASTDSIVLIINKPELLCLFQQDCILAARILMNVIKSGHLVKILWVLYVNYR